MSQFREHAERLRDYLIAMIAEEEEQLRAPWRPEHLPDEVRASANRLMAASQDGKPSSPADLQTVFNFMSSTAEALKAGRRPAEGAPWIVHGPALIQHPDGIRSTSLIAGEKMEILSAAPKPPEGAGPAVGAAKIIQGLQEAIAHARGEESAAVEHRFSGLPPCKQGWAGDPAARPHWDCKTNCCLSQGEPAGGKEERRSVFSQPSYRHGSPEDIAAFQDWCRRKAVAEGDHEVSAGLAFAPPITGVSVSDHLLEVLKAARHELAVTDNLRATDSTEVPVKWKINNSKILAQIDAVLSSPQPAEAAREADHG